MVKATQAMVETRLTEIQSLLLQGKPRSSILEYSIKKWNLRSAQIDNYIKRINKEIKERNDLTRDECRSLHIEQRKHLLEKSYECGDYKNCLSILKDIADLQGLYDYKPDIKITNIAFTDFVKETKSND